MTTKITLKTDNKSEVEKLHLLIGDHYFLTKETITDNDNGDKKYVRVYVRDG